MTCPHILPLLLPLIIVTGCTSLETDTSVTTTRGEGTIAGAIDGRAFRAVRSAWMLGRPDDPSSTLVIYLFDRSVSCGDLSGAGWDATMASDVQALKLKLKGRTIGDYPTAADGALSTSKSLSRYTITARKGALSEASAEAGEVKLTALTAGSSASGSFDLGFSTGRVTGTFVAGFCAEAREP